MTDQDQSTGQVGAEPITPASQPSAIDNTQQGVAQETQQETPQYVTKQELDGFAKEIILRVKQSDRDRSTHIKGQLQEIRGLLEKSGQQIAPQQEQALLEELGNRYDQTSSTTTQQQSLPPDVQIVFNAISKSANKGGADVKPGDPEWTTIQAALDDPNGSMEDTVLAAYEAGRNKKTRLASNEDKAAARVGGGGFEQKQPGAKTDGRTGRQMLEDAYKG